MLQFSWECRVAKTTEEFRKYNDGFSLFQSKKANVDGIIFEERGKPKKHIEKAYILNWAEFKKILNNKEFNSIIYKEMERIKQ